MWATHSRIHRGPDLLTPPRERRHHEDPPGALAWGVLGCGAEPGGDEERADLVAVQADGVGLVVDPWAADMDCGRVGDEAFLFG